MAKNFIYSPFSVKDQKMAVLEEKHLSPLGVKDESF